MAFNFQQIITGTSNLDRIQSNISKAFNSIVGPFLGGNLLTDQKIGTGNTVINHGLGRVPQVWVICDQNTDTNVWRVSWDTNSITLIAGADCVISVWVN